MIHDLFFQTIIHRSKSITKKQWIYDFCEHSIIAATLRWKETSTALDE